VVANTYTWIGPSGIAASGTISTDWSPTGVPQAGDTAIIGTNGTVLAGDGLLRSETVFLAGGELSFAGDSLVTQGNPSLDSASLITTNISPGTILASTIDALGNFVNQGTILAAGTSGSSLLIDVGTAVISGTTVAGNFNNANLIQANAGNSLTIAVGPGAVLANSGQIIDNGGSVIVRVSGANAAFSTSDGIGIGTSGSGSLTIEDGGTVTVSGGGVALGTSAGTGSTGLITVGGTGAAAVLNFGSAAAGLTVGQATQGQVVIADNGTVNLNGTAGLTIGSAASAVGGVTLTGNAASAVLNLGTAGIVVGDAGTGLLTLNQGGTVTLAGAGGISIGQTAGASGQVYVFGGVLSEGSASSGVVVSQAGDGFAALAIGANGTVSLAGGGLSIGASTAASNGTVGLGGKGALLTTSGTADIVVGAVGTGWLQVGNPFAGQSLGERVIDANALTIGAAAGSNGTVTVSGATLTAASLTIDADIGQAAHGTLNIQNGVVNLTGNATINQNGSVFLSNGTLNVATTIAAGGGATLTIGAGDQFIGTGRVVIGQNDTGTLHNLGTIGSLNGILELGRGDGFMGAGFELRLDNGADDASVIAIGLGTVVFGGGLGPSNNFTLTAWDHTGRLEFGNGETATSAVLNGSTLSVTVSGAYNGIYDFNHVTLAPNAPTNFNVGTDSRTGLSFVTAGVPCFAEGTRIRTTIGFVPVEELREGMELPTMIGGMPAPIIWLGRRELDCLTHPRPEGVWPVRVAAGAFGPGRPGRDLLVSPDHAIYVNGALVPAKCLINGGSIIQVRQDRVTYFHVELPHHDVILAEDLPVESYLDTGERDKFDRHGEMIRLRTEFKERFATDTALAWETRGVAPMIVAGPELAAARHLVSQRSPEPA
jgi:collagen type I/II/III/V/XI/XXIV/XXVII alpha